MLLNSLRRIGMSFIPVPCTLDPVDHNNNQEEDNTESRQPHVAAFGGAHLGRHLHRGHMIFVPHRIASSDVLTVTLTAARGAAMAL